MPGGHDHPTAAGLRFRQTRQHFYALSHLLDQRRTYEYSMEGAFRLIKHAHLHKIDYESCQMKTRLYEVDQRRRGGDPQAEKIRVQIEREMTSLEREKRFEEVACWRDTTRLRGDLREAMRELGQEERKSALLSGGRT